MITAIRPFMNGELPIRSPVSGLRSGAPGGSVSRPKTTSTPSSAKQRVPQPARLVGGQCPLPPACSPSGRFSRLAMVLPSRGSIIRSVMNADEDRQEDDRRDGEPEVRGQADGLVRIDQVDGVVGELDEDGVERLDQHVHGERAGDRGETQGQPGERVPADAEEGDAGQRNQDQVAGVGGDARQDADERQDVGQRPARARRSPACESAP